MDKLERINDLLVAELYYYAKANEIFDRIMNTINPPEFEALRIEFLEAKKTAAQYKSTRLNLEKEDVS